jgi:hypothetical protein
MSLVQSKRANLSDAIFISQGKIKMVRAEELYRHAQEIGKPIESIMPNSLILPRNAVISSTAELVTGLTSSQLVDIMRCDTLVLTRDMGLKTSGLQPDGTCHYPGEGPVALDVACYGGEYRIDIAACVNPFEELSVAYRIMSHDYRSYMAMHKSIGSRLVGILRRGPRIGKGIKSAHEVPEEESLHDSAGSVHVTILPKEAVYPKRV